ncbi:Adenylate and Guanylate cyclase catalytic domain containing protein [Tritrichomonas foetus]|uniref:Adenylate and Guanylate cyclase catalytic domain containing protein n=1 Tax=Tritrichomonas foetus TaxID=1144522 RepID=A0A1J4K2Y2_9EUKA|nr:Adenylate and Guanylate cyclase catalytic domain containing protein [Tritrichomonas foetus]|eukprot:OHT04086.1 Adenylate and Guanylate cyclase catalytic domain containing protein [Tritrichomonas foetus]
MNVADTSGNASSFMQNTSMSFNSSNDMKYGGLIEKSPYKKLLRQLTQLFSYVYTVAPSFNLVHKIVSIIRLLQFGGPALYAGYSMFWSDDDSSRSAVSIISIFFHIVPPDYRDVGGYYFSIIYLVLISLLIILLIISAIIYQKNANLPKLVPPMISFYFATFGNILHPIAFELCFSELSRVLFMDVEISMITVIILVVLVVIISCIFFWIYLMIATQSLMFRPNSLQTVTSSPQMVIFLSQIIVTTITGFAECMDGQKTIQSVLLFVTSIIYFLSSYAAFYYGGIISSMETAAYLSTCITGGLFSFIVAICLLIDVMGNLVFLVGFVVVWVGLMILSTYLCSKIRTRNIKKLDDILDDVNNIEDIKRVNNFINIAVDGFFIAHPVCLNWQLMKLGIEKWPKEQMPWFLYAKFISIYPEETQTLEWIFRMIISNKVKGISAKTVKEQSMSIARLREPNLSQDLKTKINTASKHISSTKQKLRRVWDLAIQGNISDIESATKRAIDEIEQSEAELMHIYRQFPNNRFVTRTYARFSRELKADHATYIDMLEKTRMLQRGITVNKDQAHEFGLSIFSNLPDKISISKDSNSIANQGTESFSTSQMEIENEEDQNQEADDSIVLVQRIETLIIPSTRYSLIIRVVMFLILFATPIIFIMVYMSSYINTLTKPPQYLQSITRLRTFLFQTTAFSMRRAYELLGLFSSVKNTTTILPASLGSSWSTVDHLVSVVSQLSSTMQSAEEFRAFDSNNKWIEIAKSDIFDSVIEYKYYEKDVPNPKQISLMSALADFILQQQELMKANAAVSNSIVNSSTLLNTIMNVPSLSTVVDEALDAIIMYISDEDDEYRVLFKIIMIVVIVVIVVFFSLALILQLIWINSNKEQVYRCLTALPKNTVSSLAENLRVLKKDTENSSSSMVNTEMNKQEDSIMKTLVAGGSSSSTKILDMSLLIVCSVIIIATHIGCTVILCNLMITETVYLYQNCPHLNYLQGAYSMIIGTCTMVTMMIVNDDPTKNIYLLTKDFIKDSYNTRLSAARRNYHYARFGNYEQEIPPYAGFRAGVLYASSQMSCPFPYEIPSGFVEATKCYSADLSFVLLEAIWNTRTIPYFNSDDEGIPDESVLEEVWGLLIFPIYDAFFEPMVSNIIDTIMNEMIKKKNNQIPIVIVMFALAFVAEVIAIIQTLRIERHMRGVLRLLLHAPSKVVLSTPKIMRVLGGDFKKNRNDSGTRSAEFFRAVVENLPDGVVIGDAEMKIISTNKSLLRVLDLNSDEVIEKSLNELFDSRFTFEDEKDPNGNNNHQSKDHNTTKEHTTKNTKKGNSISYEVNGKGTFKKLMDQLSALKLQLLILVEE